VRQHRKLPVARDEGLLVEHVGDETVVFDADTKEAHCLSTLAAVVFDSSDGRTSVDELAVIASERLGEQVEAERVLDALAQLEERDLMEPRAPSEVGHTRRSMIRKTAVVSGAVAATPLISSILAPASYAATTPGCGVNPNNVLCCPCGRTGDGNKQDCCQIKSSINLQCVCVKAEGPEVTGFNDKFCKPSGVPAEGQVPCIGGVGGGTPVRTCAECCAAQADPTQCNLTAGVNCSGAVPAQCTPA
jgi:hypothetical protein